MAGERIKIADLDLNVQELIKSAGEAKKSITELRNEQKELKKSGEEGSAQFVRNEAELKILSSRYNTLTKTIMAQVSEGGRLQSQQVAINASTEKLNQTEQEYLNNNRELIGLRKQLNVNDKDYQKNLDAINQKLDSNNSWIKNNVSQREKEIRSVGSYKEGIKEALTEMGGMNTMYNNMTKSGNAYMYVINVLSPVTEKLKQDINDLWQSFNNVTVSQEQAADGATKLSMVQKAAAVATNAGSNALKLFRVALISTGIGAIVVILGSLIAYLSTTQEGIDKITSVTRPLQAIFQSLLGVLQNLGKKLFETFSNPKKAISDLWEAIKKNLWNRLEGFLEFIPKIGKAISLALSGKWKAASKVAVDAVAKVATGVDNVTDKVTAAAKATEEFLNDAWEKGKKIDELQKRLDKSAAQYNTEMGRLKQEFKEQNMIAEDTNKSYAEREAAAKKSISDAREMKRLELERLDIEIELLKTKQSLNDTSDQEKADLAELVRKRGEVSASYVEMETTQNNKVNTIRNQAAAAAEARRQKALDDYAKKLNLELELYLQIQGEKARSVEEEIALAEEVRQKKIAIAQAEFEKTKKTENDKLALQKALNDINIEFTNKQAQAVIDNAEKEYNSIVDKNKAILDGNKFLNDSLMNQEIERLTVLAQAEKDFLNTKLGDTQAYYDEVKRIDSETQNSIDAVKKQRDEAEEAKRITDIENKRLSDQITFEEDLALQAEKDEINRQREVAQAEKTGADVNLINAKYEALQRKREESFSDFKMKQRADLITGMRNIFSEESKIGKAFAVAEIINTTVQNATKAFAQAAVYASNPLTLPLAANARIQGGIIIASGAAQVKKTVGAKFEKGGLQEIGGKRHSSGGTKFVGSDGTRFEAEQGELIGVMNRNAARHFMAFNNTYPSGGGSTSGNFFESGGIVSRDIKSNTPTAKEIAIELGAEIQKMPSPIVSVEDIITTGNKVVSVKQNANF